MAEAFIGEIQIFAFNFPPRGWATCDGQFLAIAQNQALFALLGTTYGGNGTQNFALPDLRSRAPIHTGPINTQGARAGEEAHTLILSEIPAHNHTHNASSATATLAIPTSNAFGNSSVNDYAAQNNGATAPSLDPSGGGQPHNNLQPYLTLNFSIALVGFFPSRN
jgi:microcystin-dependent protein